MNEYLNLKIGAPRRLAYLRTSAQRHNEKFPSGSAATWRAMRYATFNSSVGLSQGMQSGESVWYAHTGSALRREVYARGFGAGWYTDVDCTMKARGIVARLPHEKFLAGYEWDDNGERVYFPEIFDSETEAARRADGHAEYFAETCREDAARFVEAQVLEEEAQKLADELARELALRSNPRFPDARDNARGIIASLREKRERLQNDFAEFI